ncbi:hypothetical protein J4558_24240 [Leptolyngbya sp. 15MV]|nr:hypothetical protein J4558_24240 [Leptolyngbya sp. 15MV]
MSTVPASAAAAASRPQASTAASWAEPEKTSRLIATASKSSIGTWAARAPNATP